MLDAAFGLYVNILDSETDCGMTDLNISGVLDNVSMSVKERKDEVKFLTDNDDERFQHATMNCDDLHCKS